ncbi:MAG: hypothetical protein EOP33_05300 [Rickettsiaceae bacterium]|nr:MAG: hypothetical protein EOP33_05300 [Rickettsiaceae bacterium]
MKNIINCIKNISESSNQNLKNKSIKIYEKSFFKGRISRSGEGSDLIQTKKIRPTIPKIIEKYQTKTFLDAPYGNWYWMKKVILDSVQYIGVDIVEDLIKNNTKNFSNMSHSFLSLNIKQNLLLKSNLILCKDCLVHLSFRDSIKMI